ncbi:MAG TPA: two-component sensor histidine kinase [Acidimicrobiaceae bacterium]|nr:two-component sensor histidine kinase [Acidimicrobiaceae bacterium]
MMTTTTETSMTERPFRLGFRGRVLGLVAVLLVGAVFAGLLLQRAVLLRRLDRQVVAELEQERDEVEVLAAGSDPETGRPFAGDVRAIFDTFLRRNVPHEGEVYLTFVDGQVHAASRPPTGIRLDQQPELAERWGSLRAAERGRLGTEGGPVEFLAVPLRTGGETAGVFVVANFLRGEQAEIDDGFQIAVVVSGIVLFVAIGAAWVLAGRLLRPVRQLTDTARSIGDQDLSRRIPVDGHDEIAELGRTFNSMLGRLEEAFVLQRAFVADAGHELRTPITIVRGHLELMGDDPQDREETLAVVTDELDRMTRLVEDLLLLARAEEPDFLEIEPVELSDLTTGMITKAQTLGDRRWLVDACAVGVVAADRRRLGQAWLNLITNAVEHTGDGAEVGIGSETTDNEVRLWVRDGGTGIAIADQDRIFERFARAAPGPRRSAGAGLGLSIVRAVATAHHGRVELEAQPGSGSTFTIIIPAQPPATSSSRPVDVKAGSVG